MIALLWACAAEEDHAGPPAVYFNELVADNDTGRKDDQGDFDDWIELVAPAGVDLAGWTLASELEPEADPVVLDGATSGSAGFLLVTCDGRDAPLHAPWSLDPYGGELVLTDADGAFVDAVRFGIQHTDESWARQDDGGWTYAAEPTPGERNGI
jgi:hypothetical protein